MNMLQAAEIVMNYETKMLTFIVIFFIMMMMSFAFIAKAFGASVSVDGILTGIKKPLHFVLSFVFAIPFFIALFLYVENYINRELDRSCNVITSGFAAVDREHRDKVSDAFMFCSKSSKRKFQ